MVWADAIAAMLRISGVALMTIGDGVLSGDDFLEENSLDGQLALDQQHHILREEPDIYHKRC